MGYQVTGEEEEAKGFAAEATLYEFDDNKTWKERGKGEVCLCWFSCL
jgi:hypothetical protein